MKITNAPKTERPREKLIAFGANTLSDAELLAILLGTGTVGQSAIEMAQTMLNQFGSLRGILGQSKKNLCSTPGVHSAKYARIHAAHELMTRLLMEKLKAQVKIHSAQDAIQFLTAKLSHLQQEVFCCLFLSCDNKVIQFETLFYGTLTKTAVHPREVIKKCLDYNAARIIFAHNHPSGSSNPSEEDFFLTEKLIIDLQSIEVEVLDHLIIAGNRSESILSFTKEACE